MSIYPMARPKPKVLLRLCNEYTHKIEEVLAVDGIFAVFYDNVPISLKWASEFADEAQPKYRKTFFPSYAHARNLATRLNKQFNTTNFTVVKLNTGTPCNEAEKK
jgi:hypothetical protein